MKKQVQKAISFVILAIAVVLALVFVYRNYSSSDSKTTKIGFENIGELATQVAYCSEVNITEASRELFGAKIPFTQSKYIYSYDVEIKAGLDFTQIEYDIDEENSIIKVELPEIRVLSVEINTDSFKLYHEQESIFRQISMEENNEALTTLQQTAEKDAIANGLLDNARSNAETILESFFAQEYGADTYKIEFTDKS